MKKEIFKTMQLTFKKLKNTAICFTTILSIFFFTQCKTNNNLQQFQHAVFIDSIPPKLNPDRLKRIYLDDENTELRLDTLLKIRKLTKKFQPNDTTAILNYYISSMYYDAGQYEKALSYIREAVKIDSSNYRLYDVYGLTLMQLASDEKGEKSEKLYDEALEKFQTALKINPDSYKIKENIGDWYIRKGQKSEDDNMKYLQEAISYYSVALRRNESNNYFKLATAIIYLAKEKESKEREMLYNEAVSTLSKAVSKSSKKQAYLMYNYGGNLLILGEIAPTEKKDSLYLLSSLRFMDAIDLYKEKFERGKMSQTDFNEVLGECYNFLQHAYAWRGALAEEERATTLFNIAEMYGKKAMKLGQSEYNYACMLALKGEYETAFECLRTVLKKKKIKFSFVEKDSDWDKLRNHPSYLKLKNIYGNKIQ